MKPTLFALPHLSLGLSACFLFVSAFQLRAQSPASAQSPAETDRPQLSHQTTGRRIASTVSFTQLTGRASRSEDVVEVVSKRMAGAWSKFTPEQPLPPGEYALTRLPRAQNLFDPMAFDFAVDPGAPENSAAISATPAAKP
jgi:hypothetical protein